MKFLPLIYANINFNFEFLIFYLYNNYVLNLKMENLILLFFFTWMLVMAKGENFTLASPFGNMVITSEGIGEIKIGKKFNPQYIPEDLSKHYFCNYIGDGQPIEGLSFFEGQILIIFKSGPFQKAAIKQYIEPNPEKFAPLFLKAIKKGMIISEIIVLGSIAKTDKGVTVGSTLKMLKENYPDIELWSIPDAFRANSHICVGKSDSLPNVYFIFDGVCDKLEEDKKIIRISIHKED
jgi:hypothetical protein